MIEDSRVMQMIQKNIEQRKYEIKYFLLCYLLDKSFNKEPISFSSLDCGDAIIDLMSEYLAKKDDLFDLLNISTEEQK